jgi:hypothetical protein
MSTLLAFMTFFLFDFSLTLTMISIFPIHTTDFSYPHTGTAKPKNCHHVHRALPDPNGRAG